MTTPTIPQGNKYMDATLYTGTGASLSTTNAGGFKPDLVWIKSRSNAYNNELYDSVRGVQKRLLSNLTNAESTSTNGLTAFNSNGFTQGGETETGGNGATYVGWQWKAGGTAVSNTSGTITSSVSANTTAGFSIVSYTGTGSTGTVGHGLGAAPQMIISKNRSAAENWRVASIGLTNMASWHLNLDTTQAASNSGAAVWNNTTPTSTIFGVGTDTSVSGSGNLIVAYCWTPIAGFSQFGSYTGNGSSDGPFVYTGFRPAFVIIKRTSNTQNWQMQDTARNPYNSADNYLIANSSAAEAADVIPSLDILSNGFKIKTSNVTWNANGDNYIYCCFAENPFKYSNAR